MPTRPCAHHTQGYPGLPLGILHILQVRNDGLIETTRAQRRRRWVRRSRHLRCRADWTLPSPCVVYRRLLSQSKPKHLNEHLPAGMSKTSMSFAHCPSHLPRSLRFDLPTAMLWDLHITPIRVLAAASLINFWMHSMLIPDLGGHSPCNLFRNPRWTQSRGGFLRLWLV